MKILVTLSLALATLASADISSRDGYNYNNQQQYNGPQQPLLMKLLPSFPLQQISGNVNNPLQIIQQSQQYLPALQQTRQPLALQQPVQTLPLTQPLQQQQLKPAPLLSQALPMPNNFPAPASFLVAKQQRRPRPRVKIAKKPIVTKNFFIHSAPEESEVELEDEFNQLAAQPRKHYNVLFVRTPAQTNKAAAVNLANALKEEKTVVYVLSKKTSAADLQEAIQEAPQHINKPEVFFIKYRTPEEAANAQRQIQLQYDSLGGSSTITDEGLAPVTSVVGSLDEPEEEEIEEEQQLAAQQPRAGPDGQYEEQYSHVSNTPAQYLPPAKQY